MQQIFRENDTIEGAIISLLSFSFWHAAVERVQIAKVMEARKHVAGDVHAAKHIMSQIVRAIAAPINNDIINSVYRWCEYVIAVSTYRCGGWVPRLVVSILRAVLPFIDSTSVLCCAINLYVCVVDTEKLCIFSKPSNTTLFEAWNWLVDHNIFCELPYSQQRLTSRRLYTAKPFDEVVLLLYMGLIFDASDTYHKGDEIEERFVRLAEERTKFLDKCCLSLNEQQRDVCNMLKGTPCAIVHGSAGSGKTHLLRTLTHGLAPRVNIVVPNLGGSMAAVLAGEDNESKQDGTKRSVKTVQYLVKFLCHQFVRTWPFVDELPQSTLDTAWCFDEVGFYSTIDLAVVVFIVRIFMRSGPVLLFGDPNQLPSLSTGAALSDAIEICSTMSGNSNVIRLDQVVRSIGGIVECASSVLYNQIFLQNKAATLHTMEYTALSPRIVAGQVAALIVNEIGWDESTIVVTPFIHWVTLLNAEMHKLVYTSAVTDNDVSYCMKGQQIKLMRDLHCENCKLLRQRAVARIARMYVVTPDITEEIEAVDSYVGAPFGTVLRVVLDYKGDEYISTFNNLLQLKAYICRSYVSTLHCVQGTEAKRVIYAMFNNVKADASAFVMDVCRFVTNRHVYTVVTRAKSEVHIIGSAAQIKQAVSNKVEDFTLTRTDAIVSTQTVAPVPQKRKH